MSSQKTHSKLLKAWKEAANLSGVRAKLVSMGHNYSTLQYMIKTKDYENIKNMELVILALKQVSANNRKQVIKSDNIIQSIKIESKSI